MSIKNVIKDALGIAPVLEDRSDGLCAAVKVVDEIGSGSLEDPQPTPPSEEWVWVSGYKATEKDMSCKGYRYILDQQHNMPDGETIKECANGFHFCLKLEDVLNYYRIGRGRRFFEVSALVRKTDLDMYGKRAEFTNPDNCKPGSIDYILAESSFKFNMFNYPKDKLVAKSIVLFRELTPEEIFEHVKHDNFTVEEMELALKTSMAEVYKKRSAVELIALGFSEPVTRWLIENDKEDFAKTIMSQEGVSLDTKMLIIFTTDEDYED